MALYSCCHVPNLLEAEKEQQGGPPVAPACPALLTCRGRSGTCHPRRRDAPHLGEHVVLLGQFPNDFKVVHIVEFFKRGLPPSAEQCLGATVGRGSGTVSGTEQVLT